MGELIYKELSYLIVGIAYKIDNNLGYGLHEKTYADLFEKEFINNHVSFERELYAPIIIDGQTVAKRFIDFLVSDKIVVEIKVGDNNYRSVFNQTLEYLKANSLKLGLIIRFKPSGVQIKRVVNFV